MRKDTQERIEREASIAEALKGPTPSQTDIDIARNNAALSERVRAAKEIIAQRYGFHPELSSQYLRDWEKTGGGQER